MQGVPEQFLRAELRNQRKHPTAGLFLFESPFNAAGLSQILQIEFRADFKFADPDAGIRERELQSNHLYQSKDFVCFEMVGFVICNIRICRSTNLRTNRFWTRMNSRFRVG